MGNFVKLRFRGFAWQPHDPALVITHFEGHLSHFLVENVPIALVGKQSTHPPVEGELAAAHKDVGRLRASNVQQIELGQVNFF